jgi:hypothetical protein
MRYEREMEALLEKAERAPFALFPFRSNSFNFRPNNHPIATPSPTRS